MADSERCVWERLQMVEAEPFGEEASVTMMLIAWVSVYGHRSVSVLREKQQTALIEKEALQLIQQAGGNMMCLWDMMYEIYMQVFVRGILLCAYWSVIVYSNRCWLCETLALLSSS